MIQGLLIALLASSGLWLDVPFVNQTEKGCGSAVVWMVLQYWSSQEPRVDARPSLEQIQRTLYSEDKGGVSTTDMELFFRSLNFRTFSFQGKWPDVEHHLAQGRPLIVCLKPDGRNAPLHFVAVTGLDRNQNVVLVNDPAGRKLQKVDRANFERQWQLADNWTLLVVPH